MDHSSLAYEILGYVMLCGMVLFLGICAWKKKVAGRAAAATLVCFLLISPAVLAQDGSYRQQVDSLARSFKTKSIEPVRGYLSPALQFGPVPASRSPVILENMVTNFPELKALEIMETGSGKAVVQFDFELLGVQESTILFDGDGRITKISYLEEVLMQEIRTLSRLQNSVQQPDPGELGEKYPHETIRFEAGDGLTIMGNLYEVDPGAPVILLCHQANYNRYEYADIAPRLNELGFNALAIDQRSGGAFAGHENETVRQAGQNGMEGIDLMVEAEKDLYAAVDFLFERYGRPVTIWGSSYSSSLVFFVAEDNPKVQAVISFSPGDYFGDAKPKIAGVLANLEIPYLITSSREEVGRMESLLEGVILNDNQVQFIPESEGFHGSRALWEGQEGAEEYWEAIKVFLSEIYPDN